MERAPKAEDKKPRGERLKKLSGWIGGAAVVGALIAPALIGVAFAEGLHIGGINVYEDEQRIRGH